MKGSGCPILDALVEELADAYRRVEDDELFLQFSVYPTEITRIHFAMADHRRTCARCNKIARPPQERVEKHLPLIH